MATLNSISRRQEQCATSTGLIGAPLARFNYNPERDADVGPIESVPSIRKQTKRDGANKRPERASWRLIAGLANITANEPVPERSSAGREFNQWAELNLVPGASCALFVTTSKSFSRLSLRRGR